MGEATIITCDACGKPAVTTVTLRYDGRSAVKDVCEKHLDQLLVGTRKPARGRRRGTYA